MTRRHGLLVEVLPLAAALLGDRYGAATLELLLAPDGSRDCFVCLRPLGAARRPAAVLTVEGLAEAPEGGMGALCSACARRPGARGRVLAAVGRDLGVDTRNAVAVAAEGRA